VPGVIYYAATSLDGFIADVDDGIEWLTGFEGQDFAGPGSVPMKGSYDEFYAEVGALVMGSATYEFLVGHVAEGNAWPYAEPSWVLSSRELEPIEGADIRLAKGEVRELAPEMIEAAGEKKLWVVGGGQLVSDFAAAGLLDEVVLTIVPVVLGEGKPVFGEGLPRPLKLTGSRAFDTGMVEVSYELTSGAGSPAGSRP